MWHTVNFYKPVTENNPKEHDYKYDYFLPDFRQMEMVSSDYKKILEQQIEKAEEFKSREDSVYIRTEIEIPLVSKIELDSLIKLLDYGYKTDLVFRSCKNERVVNGFLIDLNFARVTGFTDESGLIQVLSINNVQPEGPDFFCRLSVLMNENDYVFVNYIEEKIWDSETILNYSGKY